MHIFYNGDNMKRIESIILIAFIVFIISTLCSCTQVVVNSADELKLSSWGVTLDNENEITLSFDGDFATLSSSVKNEEIVKISGLCEFSETAFVIYDDDSKIPFAFSYIVHFDRVEITYDGNTVSLYKL